MSYLLVYPGIGLMVLLYVLLKPTDRDDFSIDNSIWPGRSADWLDWLLFPVFLLAMALLFVFGLAVWPYILYRQINPHPKPVYSEPPPFSVLQEHLQPFLISVAEVEAWERVIDPLGAAPDRPFGFLNPQWQAFRSELQDGDILLPFHAVDHSDYWQTIREGYVQAGENTPGRFFITAEWRGEKSKDKG